MGLLDFYFLPQHTAVFKTRPNIPSLLEIDRRELSNKFRGQVS